MMSGVSPQNDLQQRVTALMQTTEAISMMMEVDVVLRIIADQARTLLRADGSRIHLLQPGGDTLRCVVANHGNAEEVIAFPIKIGEGITGGVAKSGKPEIVNSQDPRALHVPGTSVEPESLALVPLITQKGVIGVMTVIEIGTDTHFTEEDLKILATFARQAALAIDRAELFEKERGQRILAEALADAVMAINSTPMDINTILEHILEQTMRVVPCQATNIMLIEGDMSTVVVRRQYGLHEIGPVAKRSYDDALPYPIPTLQQMVQTRQPILLVDVTQSPSWYQTPASTWIRSFASAPLIVNEKVIGFLNVNSDQVGYFNQQTIERLVMFAAHVALAIERVRLYNDLQRSLDHEKNIRLQNLQSERKAALHRLAAYTHDAIQQPVEAIHNVLADIQQLDRIETVYPAGEIQPHLEQISIETRRIINLVGWLRNLYLDPGGRAVAAPGIPVWADDPLTRFLGDDREAYKLLHVAAVVEKLLENFQESLSGSEKVPKVEIKGELPVVNGDEEQLMLALWMLFVHVFQGEPGNAEISIAPESRGGTGMNPVPGVEITVASSANLSTNLLNLFMSLAILEAHGGTIVVEEDAPGGKRICIWLPAW